MSLLSFLFLPYLALVAGVHYALPRKYRYIWLCTASLFFYLSGDAHFVLGLAFCTGITYLAGLLLDREGIGASQAGKAASPAGTGASQAGETFFPGGRAAKGILAACVTLLILALFLFRYPWSKSPFVPLGISFYALQAMGYVVEVYRGHVRAERNLVRYAAYVSFFPTVMSGPIQRAQGLLAQLREGRAFDYARAHSGLYLLLWGYLLKFAVANPLGGMVDFAYGNYGDMPGATLLWATILYAVQLYCDFAGYSALAVGAARILGFDLAGNFAQPYFAPSVQAFWKRWHISLSSWLRDYVYIPLGGNRKGKLRKCANLMLTFLVSGLWHGAGFNYLVWGGIHGLYQVLGSCMPKRDVRGCAVRRVLRAAVTFALVDFAWLFFRADSLSQALAILHRIIFRFQFKEMTYYGSYLMGRSKLELALLLAGIILVILVDFLHEKKLSIEELAARKLPTVVRWALYIALTMGLLLVILREYGQAASNFIYTRF